MTCNKWGHLRMGHLLEKHAAPIDDTCPLIAQSSTIGFLGKDVGQWTQEMSDSFCRDSGPRRLKRSPGFKMVFPSYRNVINGHDGILSGGGLPYREELHVKQRWLAKHLHQWSADSRFRSQALPHIKTYCRYSDTEGLYWFCLTSANFSKSAWGSLDTGSGWKYKHSVTHKEEGLRVNNYEMGVLFLPRVMIKRETFPLTSGGGTSVPPFPMPFDLPLVPYSNQDKPWFYDHLLKVLGQEEGNKH